MFREVELGRDVPKSEYRERAVELRTTLLGLQNALLRDPRFSVAIVIAGVEGAGKGETVNVLHQWMDARFLSANAYGLPSEEERQRPPMWRYWRDLPPKGRIGIFFGSWYSIPIVDRVLGRSSDGDLEASLRRINAFERQLVDADVLVLKFWFHISKKVQKRRHKELLADPRTAWRVSDMERRFHKMYDEFLPVCEQVIRTTSTGDAPWHLVEGTDRRYRELYVGEHIRDAIVAHAEKIRDRAPVVVEAPKPLPRRDEPTILGVVDLSKTLDRRDYEKRMDEERARLAELSRKTFAQGTSAVLVFEGWDASGKGGAIRRLTSALDARFYSVVPISAPSDEELARPWLWRFWRRLPAAGRLTVFDRSWYGRVLVERVEGLASPEEWRRAYRAINDFESLLCEHGYGLGKFWMHIDKDEQARRFAEREMTPYKQYKITDEDYRNREKWELYEDAVNEMVERTSTSYAPWTIVPANDKRYARVHVLETVADVLQQTVDAKKGDD
ncbi:MAG: polyphosphate:AMP phosphotransferase [Myxococcota bacterium]